MKWEYMLLTLAAKTWFLGGAIDSQKLADRLNELGMDGWELVNIFDTNMLHGQTRDVIAVLKRPAVR